MAKRNWILEKDNSVSIVWRNRYNQNLTIEAHDLEDQTRIEEDKGQWYVFGALNRKGIPESPDIVYGKKEAISKIAILKKEYEKYGIEGLR